MERDRVPKPKVNWNGLAEQRIQEAQADGQFENLPGFGKPIPGIDEPHDDLWWVKDKLKREQISSLPPALAIRLDVQKTREQLARLSSEPEVRREVASLNERIRKASLGPLWSPPVDVLPLDVGAVVECWRAGKASLD
jgi:hypothetical protein